MLCFIAITNNNTTMKNNMFIDPKYLVGAAFTSPNDPKVDYIVIGYGQNETFLVIASTFDAPNNRSSVKTFKLTDIKFKDDLTLPRP